MHTGPCVGGQDRGIAYACVGSDRLVEASVAYTCADDDHVVEASVAYTCADDDHVVEASVAYACMGSSHVVEASVATGSRADSQQKSPTPPSPPDSMHSIVIRLWTRVDTKLVSRSPSAMM